MADSKNNNNSFFDMNWKNFEQFFGGKLPFPGMLNGSGTSGDDQMAWVEGYVRDVLKQAIPNFNPTMLKHHFQTELFETHNNVIVKVHIPDRAQARKIRALISANQIRLEGLPEKSAQTIRLASPVAPDSCKAVYKNGIMQFHMRKQSADETYYEIDVRYM
ncbi:Hsp20/alpha crystallin family protein [Paenibacillus allorhizosphaerae]|uniref:Hsp20/alpha crystallin family protein n=1 Tax=Paenibacillus allorhizosphaerae TaxID=2849866 RepID=A0ABM8VBT9_9BACL|nr:Hsp20/alpha crystallin family protein [Paenibacillus allorhizosphaerae]CAG7621703.1 hypothetical protein PAECIP111802_00755 [Paenibacillus allorhizosphaerae]